MIITVQPCSAMKSGSPAMPRLRESYRRIRAPTTSPWIVVVNPAWKAIGRVCAMTPVES